MWFDQTQDLHHTGWYRWSKSFLAPKVPNETLHRSGTTEDTIVSMSYLSDWFCGPRRTRSSARPWEIWSEDTKAAKVKDRQTATMDMSSKCDNQHSLLFVSANNYFSPAVRQCIRLICERLQGHFLNFPSAHLKAHMLMLQQTTCWSVFLNKSPQAREACRQNLTLITVTVVALWWDKDIMLQLRWLGHHQAPQRCTGPTTNSPSRHLRVQIRTEQLPGPKTHPAWNNEHKPMPLKFWSAHGANVCPATSEC